MEMNVAKPTTHGLGIGAGSMIDNGDGTISYRATGKLTQAFRINIGDITGFAVRKDGKLLERTFVVLGNGTELGAVSVNHGTAEKIEEWIRQQPDFRGNTQQVSVSPAATPAPSPALIADELLKLAQLRDAGVLTQDEFLAQKARLLR